MNLELKLYNFLYKNIIFNGGKKGKVLLNSMFLSNIYLKIYTPLKKNLGLMLRFDIFFSNYSFKGIFYIIKLYKIFVAFLYLNNNYNLLTIKIQFFYNFLTFIV
jgi:hypothetical protein